MLYDITSWSSLFIINNKAVFNRLTDSLCYTDVTILEIKYIPYNFMFYLKPEKEHYLRKKITFINLFKILMQRINTIGRASYCGVGKLYYAISMILFSESNNALQPKSVNFSILIGQILPGIDKYITFINKINGVPRNQ